MTFSEVDPICLLSFGSNIFTSTYQEELGIRRKIEKKNAWKQKGFWDSKFTTGLEKWKKTVLYSYSFYPWINVFVDLKCKVVQKKIASWRTRTEKWSRFWNKAGFKAVTYVSNSFRQLIHIFQLRSCLTILPWILMRSMVVSQSHLNKPSDKFLIILQKCENNGSMQKYDPGREFIISVYVTMLLLKYLQMLQFNFIREQ